MFLLLREFSVPRFDTYVPGLGTYNLRLGTYIPRLGTQISPKREKHLAPRGMSF
jgi:hypothetical protein